MWKEPYTPPPAPFKVGQLVWFEGKRLRVKACTHAHVQLEGLKYAVAVWECRAKLRNSTDPSATSTSVTYDRNQHPAAKD